MGSYDVVLDVKVQVTVTVSAATKDEAWLKVNDTLEMVPALLGTTFVVHESEITELEIKEVVNAHSY